MSTYESIVWSGVSHSFKEFLTKFRLPQIVKVQEGIYNANDEETLSTEQQLMLHTIKRSEHIKARDSHGNKLCIPLYCLHKVEILPDKCDDRLKSVEELWQVFPKFVRIVHDTPWLNIRSGDVLELRQKVEDEKGRRRFLECNFCNSPGNCVKFPIEYKTVFEPLAASGQYFLKEVEQMFSFPVRVRFIGNGLELQDGTQCSGSVGIATLDEVVEKASVIASTREDNKVFVLTIPLDLDIKVEGAAGTIKGSGNYARLCKTIHYGTQLQKAEEWKRTRAYCEDANDDSAVKTVDIYMEVAPPLPPRFPVKPVQDVGFEYDGEDNSETSESSDEYIDMHGSQKGDTNVSSRPHASNAPCVDSSISQEAPKPGLPQEEMFQPISSNSGRIEKPEDEDLPPPLPKKTSTTKRCVMQVYHGDDNNDVTSQSSFSSSFPPSLSARQCASYASRSSSSPAGSGGNQRQLSLDYYQSSTTLSEHFQIPAKVSETVYEFPDDLEGLSVEEVGKCLRALHLQQHVEHFGEERIDGTVFVDLENDLLVSLGVNNAFHRTKIMKFIKGWRPKN